MSQFLALLSNPSVITVVALVVEALFRLVPTEKPLSIMHVIVSVLKAVADFMDKILPQNVKPAA